jgi:hypothetical protein
MQGLRRQFSEYCAGRQAKSRWVRRPGPGSGMVSERASGLLSASPSRISTRSMRPPSVRFSLARATFEGSNSVVMTRPAVVPERRGQVECRNAKRGSEVDDRPRARASRQHVEQHAGFTRDASAATARQMKARRGSQNFFAILFTKIRIPCYITQMGEIEFGLYGVPGRRRKKGGNFLIFFRRNPLKSPDSKK